MATDIEEETEGRQTLISADKGDISCSSCCFNTICALTAMLVFGGLVGGILAAIFGALQNSDNDGQCAVITSSSLPKGSSDNGCVFTKYTQNCQYQTFGCHNNSFTAEIPPGAYAMVDTSFIYHDFGFETCLAQSPCDTWQPFDGSYSFITCDVVVDCLNGTNTTVSVTLKESGSTDRENKKPDTAALLQLSTFSHKQRSTTPATPEGQTALANGG